MTSPRFYFCPSCGATDSFEYLTDEMLDAEELEHAGKPWACNDCGYECNDLQQPYQRPYMPAFDDLDGPGMMDSNWSHVALGLVLLLYRQHLLERDREGAS